MDIELIKEIITSGLSLIALIIALFKKGRVTTNSELEAIKEAKEEVKKAKKNLKNIKKQPTKSNPENTITYNQTNQQNQQTVKQTMIENKAEYLPALDYLDKNYKKGEFEEDGETTKTN